MKLLLFLELLLSVTISETSFSDGGSSDGGGFAYEAPSVALQMAAADLINFMPSLGHRLLNEESRGQLKIALQNLTSEPDGPPRFREGKRLFMDFEITPVPKLIATEYFFVKYAGISKPTRFIKSPQYFQLRRDLLHELGHVLGLGESDATDFANTVTLGYYRKNLTGVHGLPIGMGDEFHSLYKPSSFKIYFRAFPKWVVIDLKPDDPYGYSYQGRTNQAVCNSLIAVSASIAFEENGKISGILTAIPPVYSSIPCDNVNTYVQSREISGNYDLK